MSKIVERYVRKISNHEINDKTGEPWTIEDVPIKWREEVREALENWLV